MKVLTGFDIIYFRYELFGKTLIGASIFVFRCSRSANTLNIDEEL